jgi:hypothetical protein
METATEKKTVMVACSVVNGLTLRLFKHGRDDIGSPIISVDGPKVILNGVSALYTGAGNTEGAGQAPGITEVDAGFMDAWVDQNRLNPLVDMGMVKVLEEGEDAPAPEWPPQGSAIGVPDGERRHGSTGQMFEAREGRWVRVEE